MPLFSALLFRRLACLLALLVAGAGCQNAKVAFQFRPASPLSTTSAATTVTVVASANCGRLQPPTAIPVPVLAQVQPAVAVAARPRLAHRMVGPAASAAHLVPKAVRPASQRSVGKQLLRHPLAPAENGLGTTFIGILGILLLLVGLVGLIFSGGGFFGLLALIGAIGLTISILAPIIRGY